MGCTRIWEGKRSLPGTFKRTVTKSRGERTTFCAQVEAMIVIIVSIGLVWFDFAL